MELAVPAPCAFSRRVGALKAHAHFQFCWARLQFRERSYPKITLVDMLPSVLEHDTNGNELVRLSVAAAPDESRVKKPVNFVKKGWGSELWLANGELYCGKIPPLRSGQKVLAALS